MDPQELTKTLHEVANDVLLWIGFGTLAGLLAKAIMPGRDPGGAVATLLMGIGGSVMGSGVLMYFWEGHRVTPISPEGFVVATAGAFVLLIFYRFFRRDKYYEGEQTRRPYFAGGSRRGRGKREVIIEE